MRKYYILMKEIDDLEEGFCCGHSERGNMMYHRTDNKREADFYDDYNAVLVAAGYRQSGYPCEVVPKVSAKRQLEILGG